MLIEAHREARDVLPLVDSRALPERIAAIRRRVQQQLDLAEDEARFEPMSERAIALTHGWR